MAFSISGLYYDMSFLLPISIDAILIYIMNRYYFRIYKEFPFEISIDNEKMICTDYFLSNKKIELKLSDIDNMTGGMFGKNPTKPIYVYSSAQNIKLGIYHHAKDFNKLVTVILSNVNKELYDRLIDGVKELKDLRQLERKTKLIRKKSKKKKKK